MKLILTLALTLTVSLQTQTSTPASSDLVVLKFRWSKHSLGSGLIRSVEADPAPGPIVIDRTPTRDPNYQRPAASPTERRADLAALERDAVNSSDRPTHFYVYSIQVKNAGTRPIKSFVWAFVDPAETIDSAGRQFVCAVKAKPNDTKKFEIASTLAPSRVVDASKAPDETEKTPVLTAIINRIEYGDGTSWERPDWDSSILDPAGRPKLDSGKCERL